MLPRWGSIRVRSPPARTPHVGPTCRWVDEIKKIPTRKQLPLFWSLGRKHVGTIPIFMTDTFLHLCPLLRDSIQYLGARECSKNSVVKALADKESVLLVPGEALPLPSPSPLGLGSIRPAAGRACFARGCDHVSRGVMIRCAPCLWVCVSLCVCVCLSLSRSRALSLARARYLRRADRNLHIQIVGHGRCRVYMPQRLHQTGQYPLTTPPRLIPMSPMPRVHPRSNVMPPVRAGDRARRVLIPIPPCAMRAGDRARRVAHPGRELR